MAERTRLAWWNLLHDPGRTAVAVAGIGFSLVVIFLQLGFFQAVTRTATIILGKLDYDIMIVSKDYHYVADAGTFPLARIRQAQAVAGVRRVMPLYVRNAVWRSLAPRSSGRWPLRPILAVGLPRGSPPFRVDLPGFSIAEARAAVAQLDRPDAVAIDRRNKPEFGPRPVEHPRTGYLRAELNMRPVKVVSTLELGTGFAAEGAAFVGPHNLAGLLGPSTAEAPSLGLVQLEPGAAREAVLARLQADLPAARAGRTRGASGSYVRVFTRAALEAHERDYWINDKAIGILFQMGVGVSFLVGLVVVYQVLSSDIADHLSEYATLKALGYDDGRISAIVVEQAILLGLVGYVGALLVAAGLYALVEHIVRIPMSLRTPWILGIPLFLALVMSSSSALLAVQKVRAADPAELFR
jgi:putative ABC transport system permease protein